jgi:putative copper resistance protein D
VNQLLILSRAVHFGSCLVLLSVFVVRLLVERPTADAGVAPRRLALLCLAAAAGSGFLWFWMAAAGMNGSGLKESFNLQLFQVVLEQTPPGQVWIVRSAIAVALGGLLCFPRGRWRWVLGLVLTGSFTASLAWLGHAGAGEDGQRALMLTADVVHLLAAGLWPAGLVPFALLLRRQIKAGSLITAHMMVHRFSKISLMTVGMLAASGLINAYFLVGSFHALVATAYGRLLIVKLTSFAAAIGLGACNLLIHKPQLETAPEALGAMANKVCIEVSLGTLIVLIVAIMGTLPPGSTATHF